MRLVLLCLLILVTVVSCPDNRDEIRKILAFPGEAFTLYFYEDEVKEIALVDKNGEVIARIEGGNLVVIKKSEYNISSQNSSFHLPNGAKKGQHKFTLSVLYMNGSHRSQHYLVTVSDDQVCSEMLEIRHPAADSYIILYYGQHEVEEIRWDNSSGWPIGVTKHKAKLQILDPDYEGRLSVMNVSLLIHGATIKDHGNYTAMVLFQNGTQCLQRYVVTSQGSLLNMLYYLITSPLLGQVTLLLLVLSIIHVSAFVGLRKSRKARNWLRKILRKYSKQDETEYLARKNGISNQDNLPPEEKPFVFRVQKDSKSGEMERTVNLAAATENPEDC